MSVRKTFKTLAPLLALSAAGHAGAQANLSERVFSLDIGSDTEISDPAGGAFELADPGDMYASSNVAGSMIGAPHMDDAGVFGADPAPQQFAPATAVPVGNGNALYTNYFDRDGYDSVDRRLDSLDLDPNAPLQGPIYRDGVQLDCVRNARHLEISFNDDDITGWRAPLGPRVPTEGPSPMGNIYGTTAAHDEVIALELGIAGGFPATVVGSTGSATERGVHVDLELNPDAGNNTDDDVDALDHTDSDVCNVHLFSADNEARLNLVPSTIYQRSVGMAPAPVIKALHLGIPATADIDAFELVWLPVPGNGQQALALIYSVDPDDPATAIDESGGGSPNTIYASFLNATSFVLVDGNDNQFDDIDALATRIPAEDSDGDGVPDANDNCIEVWNPDQVDTNGDGYGNFCDQDLDGDGDIDIADLGLFRLVFFTSDPDADFDQNGVVNLGDLASMRLNFFGQPGPSGLVP